MPEHGNTITFHVDLSNEPAARAIMTVVDTEGNETLNLWTHSNVLRASDGYEDDGETPRVPHPNVAIVGASWHRFDIELHGDQYLLTVDRNEPVTLRTFTPTDEGVGLPGVAGIGTPTDIQPAHIERVRYYPEEAVLETFRSDGLTGWSIRAQTGPTFLQAGHVEVQPQAETDLGFGRLLLRAPGDLDGLTYVGHPMTNTDYRYTAEVSFTPWRVSLLIPHGVPDHQAVLAGISGDLQDPQVQWALVMAQTGLQHHYWGLYLIGPDGTRTLVSPAQETLWGEEVGWSETDPSWHTTRIHVDETTGTLIVQVDDAEEATRFTFDSLGTSDHIALGDVFKDHIWWSGGGISYYDDFALYPWGEP